MNPRHVHALHLLVSRERRYNDEVLLFDHDRWPAPHAGGAALTVPTKKIAESDAAPTDGAVTRTLANLLADELELGLRNRHFGHRLRVLNLRLDSPTRGVPTDYHILPVILPLCLAERRRVERRLDGEWLTVEGALAHPRLSPTARQALLESGLRSRRRPTTPRQPTPRAEELKRRIVAARAGNLDAFAALVVELRPLLESRLRSCPGTAPLCAVQEDVEDVLSDVTAQALASLPRFDAGRGSVEGWLWTLTRNAAVSLLRRAGRRAVSLDALPTPYHLPSDPRLPDPALQSAEEEDRAQKLASLERVLATADPLMRRACELRLQERTYAEIGLELNVPAKTVGVWFYRLAQKVRAEAAR